MNLIYFPIIVSIFGIAFVWFLILQIRKIPAITQTALITGENVITYLKSQLKRNNAVAIIVFFLLLFTPPVGSWKVAVGFLLGVALSVLAGAIGIIISTQTNTRITEAEKRGPAKLFDISFKHGLAQSISVVSLGLLGVSGYYFLTGGDLRALVGLGFGAALVSVFSGSENFADIFETYTLIIIASIILGTLLFPRSLQFVLLPLILASVSILATIIGSFFAGFGKSQNNTKAAYKGIFATTILSAIGFYFIVSKLMDSQAVSTNNLYFSALVGLVVAVLLFFVARRYVAFPVLLICVGIFASYWFAGIYGIALAFVAAISVLGIIFTINVFDSAVTKGYLAILAGLAGLVLFFAYSEQVGINGLENFILNDPKVIIGILAGGLLPYLYVLRKIKKPLLVALIPILAPIIIGFIFGAGALGGLIIGTVVVGLFISIVQQPAATGDTAGSSVGPTINSLIKVLCIMALLVIGFLV